VTWLLAFQLGSELDTNISQAVEAAGVDCSGWKVFQAGDWVLSWRYIKRRRRYAGGNIVAGEFEDPITWHDREH
jgi:hypothetical protein